MAQVPLIGQDLPILEPEVPVAMSPPANSGVRVGIGDRVGAAVRARLPPIVKVASVIAATVTRHPLVVPALAVLVMVVPAGPRSAVLVVPVAVV